MTIDTAMIMAAGLGTRMRPLTLDRPKPLVKVAGRTLLDHCLDQIKLAKVKNVTVNVHYRAEMVEDHMANIIGFDTVHISDERNQLLETGGGLIKARPLLGDKPFFCLNSDNIWTNGKDNALLSLSEIWDDNIMDALLLLVPTEQAYCHKGVGDFYLGSDNEIIRRGDRGGAPYIYTGIQIISHRLLRDAPEEAFSTNILWNRAIAENRLFGAVHDGKWFDIGAPDAIEVAQNILKNE